MPKDTKAERELQQLREELVKVRCERDNLALSLATSQAQASQAKQRLDSAMDEFSLTIGKAVNAIETLVEKV